jgi:glycosyltransferase involved in cell wall biosynthesis
MRILYLHQYFATPQSSGGTRSYEFALRLIANGHDVHFISSASFLPEQYKHFKKITTIVFDGIPVTIIPVSYNNNMSFVRRIFAFFNFAWRASAQAAKHKPDLIFATSTPLTIAIPGIIAKLFRRKPMVFEVRDLWPEVPIAIGALNNPILRWAGSALEWVAYHSSKHIIALSPGMAEGVTKRGIAEDRVTVIPNSCDIAVFDVPKERGQPIRKQLCIDSQTPLIAYTGTLGHINGVSYIVELAAEMLSVDPGIHFLIVGDGVEREIVNRLAVELGVQGNNLTIWTSVPKDRIPDILAAADIATSVVIPLKPMWNNSANKFFDALAARKPIAINHGGWQKDLLEESGAGIALPHDDLPQAAALLAQFARDPERLSMCGAAAHRLAQERFDRDLMFDKLEAVFKQAVGKSS